MKFKTLRKPKSSSTPSKSNYCVVISVALLCSMLVVYSGGNLAADQFDDALTALNNGQFPRALRMFRELAKQDNANARYNLAIMYAKGQGTSVDLVKAKMWINLSAMTPSSGPNSDENTIEAITLGVKINMMLTKEQRKLSSALTKQCIYSQFTDCD